jgi:hypothetical protein
MTSGRSRLGDSPSARGAHRSRASPFVGTFRLHRFRLARLRQLKDRIETVLPLDEPRATQRVTDGMTVSTNNAGKLFD